MQEARTISQARSDALRIAHSMTQGLQRHLMTVVHLYIGRDTEVIASAKTTQMRAQIVEQCLATRECSGVLRIREELDAILLEYRRLRWQRSGLFVLGGDFLGSDLAGFYVRLIERIDADHRAGYGSGDLPAKEFLPYVVDLRNRDVDDRMPGGLDRRHGDILSRIRCGSQAQGYEQTILAVNIATNDVLQIDRDNPLPTLPRRVGKQPFKPCAWSSAP